MCAKRDEAHLAAARQAGNGDVIDNVRDPLTRLPGHGLWRTMTPAPCKIAPFCGLEIDRDENAAINILVLGLQRLGVSPRSSPFTGESSHAAPC